MTHLIDALIAVSLLFAGLGWSAWRDARRDDRERRGFDHSLERIGRHMGQERNA